MAKVLVLYYSAFGYVAIMANSVAEGARAAGAEVDVKRVMETAPATVSPEAHFRTTQSVPAAQVDDLANYDAVIVGSPTRHGRMSAHMATFLEQVGDSMLTGKIGGAFTSPTSGKGGQETAALSILTNLLHLGMIVAGPPYCAAPLEEDSGQRHPGKIELEHAAQLGKLIAETANRLSREWVERVNWSKQS